MRKHRSYPVDFKRQVAQEYLAGETLHGLARRHEINRNLVRIWVAKYEAVNRRGIFTPGLECTPASGQDQAADLTICRACSFSNDMGLRYPRAECSRLLL
jgi:transposase-like protein